MTYKANDNRYDGMLYKRCGRSGIDLPAISLGLWQNFGAVDDFNVCRDMLVRAFDLGVTHFDLANNYGPPPGSAEETFAKVLRSDFRAYRDEMIISTKAGYHMWPGPYGQWGSRKNLLASLDQSLKRLGLEYVDIFYSHRPDPNTPIEETMSALDHAVRQGKALYAGISNYNPQQTEAAVKVLKELKTPCLIHQVRYSMLSREPEDRLLEILAEEGVGCIAFCPLFQGLLTDKYLRGIPDNSRAAKSNSTLKTELITQEMVAKLNALNDIASKRGQSLAQMALSWILRRPEITSVLVGTSCVAQLEQNVATLENLEFSDDELKEIGNVLSR